MRKQIVSFLIFICTTLPHFLHAQFLDTLNSALHQKPKFFFQLNSYNSLLTGTKANAFGFKIGLDFARKIRFGVGYFTLNTDIVEQFTDIKQDDTIRAELKSNYFTVGAEYIFYNKGPWQISVPAHIGFGKSYFRAADNVEGGQSIHKGGIVLFEPAITGHYKIIKWVGVGFGMGYRFMLKNNPQVHHNFNSPIYVLRVKIFFDEIFYSIFPSKRKNNTNAK